MENTFFLRQRSINMFLSWIAYHPHWLFCAPMAAGTWALGELPDETQLEIRDGEEDDSHDAKSHVVLPQPPGGVIHALLLQKLLPCTSAHKSSPAVTTEATTWARARGFLEVLNNPAHFASSSDEDTSSHWLPINSLILTSVLWKRCCWSDRHRSSGQWTR